MKRYAPPSTLVLVLLGSLVALAAGCNFDLRPPSVGPTVQSHPDLGPRFPPPDLGFPFPPPDIGFPPDEPDFGVPAVEPSFGPTVQQADPPPAITGGTLAISHDGRWAIAADPDRDHVYVVDTSAQKLSADIALQPGDEPGRIAEDAAGNVYVALRRGGAVVTIDPVAGTLVERRATCPAPRGIAYDASASVLHVACAGGELVTLPTPTGAATRTVWVARDLRDVLVDGSHLYLTRFRSAELLVLDANGQVTQVSHPPAFQSPAVRRADSFSAAVAWRAVLVPGSDKGLGSQLAVVHERGDDDAVTISQPGGYGGDGSKCDGSIVHSAVTTFAPGGVSPSVGGVIIDAVLPVDLAISADGAQWAVASPANARVAGKPQVLVNSAGNLTGDCAFTMLQYSPAGEITALAFDAAGHLWAQSREPAALFVLDMGVTIPIGNLSREDTGHAVFHSRAGGGLACASCHPEGGEDGRTWQFDPIGPRRTQSIRGGILSTAPFHWDGDLADIPALASEVLVRRMSGVSLDNSQLGALGHFIDALPLLPPSPPADPQSVARGEQLFNDAQNVGCINCHSGNKMTNNDNSDVGTGGLFQVPSLIGVGFRAPYLHDGRAPTLADRFGPDGGGDAHGQTSQLSQADITDLVHYLESL